MQLAPDNIFALNNLATIYTALDDPRAKDYAERAYWRQRTPATADTLGWALVKDGQASEGLYYLRRANENLPTNGTVLYHLAAALDGTGDDHSARELLEKALNQNKPFDGKDDAEKLLARLKVH